MRIRLVLGCVGKARVKSARRISALFEDVASEVAQHGGK